MQRLWEGSIKGFEKHALWALVFATFFVFRHHFVIAAMFFVWAVINMTVTWVRLRRTCKRL